jgi:hypothetical protein
VVILASALKGAPETFIMAFAVSNGMSAKLLCFSWSNKNQFGIVV